MSFKSYLFPGESFVIQDKSGDSQISRPDEAINEKYKKGEVRIVTEQARYPLDTIATMIDSKKYNLNPEYQRRKRWGNERKSRLIESFIMNVPIPPIFLYEVDYSFYEVMDGQQRLTAIYDFYKGELEGLEYWQELNGRKYQNLPEQVKRGVDRRYLSSIILLQETAKSDEEAEFLKQIVFERLNSGGEKLTPQETRNALYGGKFNAFCIKLSENDLFREMWQLPLESDGEVKLLDNDLYREMGDVELVLRFFAYRHIEKHSGMTVKKFLDEYLKQANKISDETIKQIESLFNDTIEILYEIFGESAFLPPVRERQSHSPAKIIYDSIMQAVAKTIKSKGNLMKNAKIIKDNLYRDKRSFKPYEKKNVYLFDGMYTHRNAIQTRIDFYHDFLQNYIS